jgi:hypothetical protein
MNVHLQGVDPSKAGFNWVVMSFTHDGFYHEGRRAVKRPGRGFVI